MEGTVRKRGSRWYYSFEAGTIQGKRKRVERVGGNTKKEALAALRIALNEFERCGSVIDESNISIADYLDLWFEQYVLVNLKHNTQENYRATIKNHIKPALGSYRLKNIHAARLQTFLNEKKEAGFARQTVDIMRCIFVGAFKYAVHPLGLIKENPTQYVKMPRYDETPKDADDLKIISVQTYRQILDLFPQGNSFHIPLQIGFHTGMRVSEVSGLTWSCVDLINQTIKVEKILINKQGEWVFGTPKSKASYRTIPIGHGLVEVLKNHKASQEANSKKYGEHYIDSDFVCTKENGQCVHPGSIKSSTRTIVKKIEVPFNFHSLRHTHATLLIEAGANMKDVQARLGHSRIAVTMDTYTKVTKKMQTETVDIFERAMQS